MKKPYTTFCEPYGYIRVEANGNVYRVGNRASSWVSKAIGNIEGPAKGATKDRWRAVSVHGHPPYEARFPNRHQALEYLLDVNRKNPNISNEESCDA